MFKPIFDSTSEVILTHNFLLTINSNKSFFTEEVQTAKSNMVTSLSNLFSIFSDFIDIFLSAKHGGSKYNRKPLTNVSFEDIATNVSVIPRIEIGSKVHRLHSHSIVSWAAPDKYFFQINRHRLKEYIDNNLPGYHMDIKWVKGSSEINRVISYINKNPVSD